MNNGRFGMTFKTRNNNYYFFDSGTGKVVLCDYDEIELIDKILSNKISVEDACLQNKDFQKFVEYENIFAFPDDIKFVLPTLDALKESIEGHCRQIILELTEKCNLRCGYCIYNENHPGFRNFGNRTMSFDVAKKTIDIVLKNFKDDKFYLTFYGGEPLLAFDLMKESIDYVRNNYPSIKLGISLTTNLTLLSDSMLEYFNSLSNDKINVNIMCSIDGDRDNHDRFRRYSNGERTHEVVVDNFKKLVLNFYEKNNSYKHLSINCVVSPPCDNEKIERIRSFFEEELRLHQNIKYDLGYVDPGDMVFDYSSNEKIKLYENLSGVNICDHVFEHVAYDDGDEIKKTDLNIILNDIMAISHRVKNNPNDITVRFLHGNCIPGRQRMYVTVNGDFKVCERVGNSPSIGNYIDGLDYEKILNLYYKEYAATYENICGSCWAQQMCNICYAKNFKKEGIISDIESLCTDTRNEIKNKFINYYSLFESNKEMLENTVKEIVL